MTMTSLPEPARDATVTSLAPLLDHMRASGRTCGLSMPTVVQISSAWRRIHTVLPIPDTTLVADFTIALRAKGKRFRSGSTYATRIRLAVRCHDAWMSGDPQWHQLSIGGRTATARPLGTPDERVRSVVTPLRRSLDVRLDLPWDLTAAEADMLATLIGNHVDPDTRPHDNDPATT
ncbi:hypothetical protein R8Z50_22765 [Longispora sp. K20-0274]|uniref:hypothetical protein n=1 Tax=Longispora sp. K20-0274 TaxID=3088255 RepID=UPI00399C4169